MGKIKQFICSVLLVVLGYAIGGPIFGTVFTIAAFAACFAPTPGCSAHTSTFGWVLVLFIPGCFIVGFIPTILGGIAIAAISALGASDPM